MSNTSHQLVFSILQNRKHNKTTKQQKTTQQQQQKRNLTLLSSHLSDNIHILHFIT